MRTDPATGRTWVYAITGPLTGADFSGKPLIRFDLAHPEVRETVWDQTEVSLDNFQVSDDGRHAAGLFPWPQAGRADLRRGTWTQSGQGCWTSLAPDKSGVMWIFDGSHRAGCEFSGVQTLLTLAIVEAKSGSRGWGRQKNTWHAESACWMEGA